MKKLNIIILTLGVIAVMLSSCKKDKPSQITESPQTNYTAEDIRIQNLILNFQNKIKNNTFKNGETVSVDSAVWFLEAMMNFNYSTPDSSFVNLTVDTTFEFDLPVNNDLVDFSNLTEAAFAMESHILTYLNNMPNSIKFIIAADVSIKPNTLKDGTKTITITTGYGSEYIINPGCYTPFGANDFWAHGFDWGGCGTNSATTSDAAKQIQYKINNPNCHFIDPTNNTYVINLNPVFVAADWYPASNYNNDNWLDYLMYYEDDAMGNNGYNKVIDGCLEPEEMNFYLQGTLDVIQIELLNLQSLYPDVDLEFVYIQMQGDIIVPVGITTWLHSAEITYGKRISRIEPIE
jgi:hypothetical protein